MTSGWQGVLSNVNLNFGVSGPLSCSQTALCSTYRMLTRLPKGWAYTWPPIRPAYHMKSGFDYHELNLESVTYVCLVQMTGWRRPEIRGQGRRFLTEGPRAVCSAAPLHLVFTELPENALDEQLCWWTMHWCPSQIHPLPTINMQTTSQYMNTHAPTYSSKQKVEIKCGSLLSIPYWFRKVAAHCPSNFSLANTEWLWNIPYGPLQHSNYVSVRCCKERVLSDEGPWCI